MSKIRNFYNRAVVGVAVTAATVGVAMADTSGVDTSSGVTIIGTAIAAIAGVGAAKLAPTATLQVWGFIKQAFSRT
ncbi:hypothetical protein [Acinetobacter nectaris]|uniref:hypothetical protein n=1 Tax=Acinetobacter nectaris TaxID=1219382 RepID=UPI001F370132|nr:hypothetical protein [Acinetobacter nectaris]MCF9045646.1 hypothetical protein [Acinetobacter nectaris]